MPEKRQMGNSRHTRTFDHPLVGNPFPTPAHRARWWAAACARRDRIRAGWRPPTDLSEIQESKVELRQLKREEKARNEAADRAKLKEGLLPRRRYNQLADDTRDSPLLERERLRREEAERLATQHRARYTVTHEQHGWVVSYENADGSYTRVMTMPTEDEARTLMESLGAMESKPPELISTQDVTNDSAP